ncbi:MAG: NYN domain-containing protein [Patescibacteria group bacterium]
MLSEHVERRLAVRIKLDKSKGSFNLNLQYVLNALWRVVDENGVVERPKEFLAKSVSSPMKYIDALAEAGCLEIIASGESKRRIITSVKLLERQLSKGLDHKKEEASKPTPVVLPKRAIPLFNENAPKENEERESVVIFIDAPNLVNKGDLGMFLGGVLWHKLIKIIAGSRKVEDVFAYVSIPDDVRNHEVPEWLPAVKMSEAGIKMIWREGYEKRGGVDYRKRDIDAMMNYDLGIFPRSPLDSKRVYSDVKTIVLVTADSDFSRAIRDFAEIKKINVEIFCWKEGLSPRSSLRRYASRVVFLNEFCEDFLPVLSRVKKLARATRMP